MVRKNKKISNTFFKKNCKGWVRFVEVFVSILLIIGVIMILIDQSGINQDKMSDIIYEKEFYILRAVQTNSTLREEIISNSVPLEWENFPDNTKNRIISLIPSYMDCVAKICELDSSCELENSPEQSVYAKSISIFSTIDTYSPKQLKIFCWEK